MNCNDVTPQLSLYATGDLPERETEQLREHLAVCPDCARALESEQAAYDVITRIVASDNPESLPSDFAMSVQRRVVAGRAHSWNPFRIQGITRLPLLAPAAVVVALVAILLFALSRAPRESGLTDLANIDLNGQSMAGITALAAQYGGAVKGPIPLDSWDPSGEPGVFMLLHKPGANDASDSYALDYCGESGRLQSYEGSPWIRQRAGRLIARAGSKGNIYIIIIVLRDLPNTLRQRIERDIRRDYQPFFNDRNGV